MRAMSPEICPSPKRTLLPLHSASAVTENTCLATVTGGVERRHNGLLLLKADSWLGLALEREVLK